MNPFQTANSGIGPGPASGSGSGSKSVEYTISQDRSTGNAAQVEQGFALLAKGDALSPLASLGLPLPNNGALQDYQMQLMLLEQQNKKRMMMARQEQDRANADRANATGSGPDPDYCGDGSNRNIEIPTIDDQTNIPPVPEQRPREPFSGGEDPDNQLGDKYCVLYRVSCQPNMSSQSRQCHQKIYQDEPHQVTIRAKYEGAHVETHLAGDKPVPDLRAFLSELPKLAFVVYRNVPCGTGSTSTSSILGINSSNAKRDTSFCEIISVVSEDLQKALQKISLFSPDRSSYGKRSGSYGHPGHTVYSELYSSNDLSASPSEYTHLFLYHHRQVLREALSKDWEEATLDALRALLEYMDVNPSPMYDKCDSLFSRGIVTQETLPWLYAPNEVLVTTNKKGLQTAAVLRSVPEVENGGSVVQLHCWYWGYNGHKLRRKDNKLPVQIQSYGETAINQLAVYPLRFATQEVKDKILANGRKFWEHRKPAQVAYQGWDYQRERSYPPDSRFMIDYQVYSKFHTTSPAFVFSLVERAAFDTWPEEISNDDTLSDDQLMLLPADIHGFFFKEKKWMNLLVDNIQPIKWNKVAFEQLVLPKRTKTLVKALVMVRKQAREEQSGEDVETGVNESLKKDDIIAGKGNGLIMLLHGGPGTGKTLTAGNVAEIAEMPLYSVTCGDIGTKPEAVEQYLNTVLYLGKKWNCVLLLDEADVFLEQRSLSDLDRNSLVSVFLRTLEYYDGVLILTSNRVSTFDDAFKSRIQLALHYPALDAPGRRKIWSNFLNMLEQTIKAPASSVTWNTGKSAWQEQVDLEDIKSHMDELASYELNGRQIRNALTTARQLAVFEKTVLDWEGLKDSIEVAGDFNRYVESMSLSLHELHLGGGGSQPEARTERESLMGGVEEGSWISTGTFR
ncbi:Fidgetin-like protein 1 [Naviculisporaceae sp. PSN 640]